MNQIMQNELRSDLATEINGVIDFPMFKCLKPEEISLMRNKEHKKYIKKGW